MSSIGERSGSSYAYVGSELDLFAQATNWKSYWGRTVRRLMGPRVLDVGAGIGATAHLLCDDRNTRWVSIEPDSKLVQRLQARQDAGIIPHLCEIRLGTVCDLTTEDRFDTILYIDVLEHIADDLQELRRAARHLDIGGRLVVLAPAHQFLFTRFDKAIGHYRRYDRRMISALDVLPLTLERVTYLDSVGLLASLANKLFLHSEMPTASQIGIWDTVLVPLSRVLDPLFSGTLGKSVLAVWRR